MATTTIERSIRGTSLLKELRATNYRTARELVLELGNIGAFIGEPGAGKSNVLAAVSALLFPWDGVTPGDVRSGQTEVSLEATLSDGRRLSLNGTAEPPGAVVIPASLRADELFQHSHHGQAPRAAELFTASLEESPAPRVAFVHGLEACAQEVTGVVFLIEEPELFLAPQGHRYLYRLFHRLADGERLVTSAISTPIEGMQLTEGGDDE